MTDVSRVDDEPGFFHASVLTLYPEMFPGPLALRLQVRHSARPNGSSMRCRFAILRKASTVWSMTRHPVVALAW